MGTINFWCGRTNLLYLLPSRTYHYSPYLYQLNTDGLSFPLPVKDVSKFENQNSDIAVSVGTCEDRQLIPLYISPHRNRKYTIHLLLLSDEKTHHYTYVKNSSRLVTGRTKHGKQTYVCPYCFHCFSYQHVLGKRIPDCSTHTLTSDRDICNKTEIRGFALQDHPKRISRPIRSLRSLRNFYRTVCGQRLCQRTHPIRVLLFKGVEIRRRNFRTVYWRWRHV